MTIHASRAGGTGSSRLVVTGCDAGSFPLARQCVFSLIERVRGVDVAVLDFGLDDEQRSFFRAHGAWVRAPDISVLPGVAQRRRGVFSRPLLPQIFPDHELLMWLDADSVVLQGRAVEDFFAASLGGAIAIVPELHHAYHRYSATESRLNALHLRAKARRWRGRQAWLRGPISYDPYRALYGETVAERLAFRPVLNTGAVALRRDAPVWARWARELGRADPEAIPEFDDQAALNVAVELHDLPVEALSATHNWLPAKALPLVDPDHGVLRTPSPDHEPIGILHFAGLARDRGLVLETMAGGRLEVQPPQLLEALKALEPARRPG